jgi:hypothetical protein
MDKAEFKFRRRLMTFMIKQERLDCNLLVRPPLQGVVPLVSGGLPDKALCKNKRLYQIAFPRSIFPINHYTTQQLMLK